ncbi:MAG: phospholipase D-like domain-containing protein [Nocardioides sp.]
MARFLVLLVATACFLVPTGSPASAAPDNFSPRPGPTFNSPIGDGADKRAIFHKIIRAINSSPRRSEIKIFSWNFLTREGTDALLRAQNRGVMVRLLMDNTNNTEIPNQPFRRLKAGLHSGNRHEKRNSWARVCNGSCRGKGGSAHAKFFMFSQSGKVRRVVMQGSANLTLASTNNQWNDIYTHTRNKKVWKFYTRVFREATRDRKARSPFTAVQLGTTRLMMFPLAGKKVRDPVMQLLNKVKCKNATNTPSHRTRIRIAPDVIRQDRGMDLAKKVRQLWNQGCDVRIGYTVVGITVGRMLRDGGGRGPVPMKHLVQDFNGDGEFDNYFHLKSMTIVGNVGGDRSNYVMLNGSANWSGLARASDENLGVYWNKARTLQYQKHLDYWYTHFPESRDDRSDRTARVTTFPATSDQLVFGTGPDAEYESGTPYSRTGVDPYANFELD